MLFPTPERPRHKVIGGSPARQAVTAHPGQSLHRSSLSLLQAGPPQPTGLSPEPEPRDRPSLRWIAPFPADVGPSAQPNGRARLVWYQEVVQAAGARARTATR